MKKIQFVFAVAALLFAGAGVFASSLVDYQFYRKSTTNLTPGAFCDVAIDPQVCTGSSVQCHNIVLVSGEYDDYLISKREIVNGQPTGTCVQVLEAQ